MGSVALPLGWTISPFWCDFQPGFRRFEKKNWLTDWFSNVWRTFFMIVSMLLIYHVLVAVSSMIKLHGSRFHQSRAVQCFKLSQSWFVSCSIGWFRLSVTIYGWINSQTRSYCGCGFQLLSHYSLNYGSIVLVSGWCITSAECRWANIKLWKFKYRLKLWTWKRWAPYYYYI